MISRIYIPTLCKYWCQTWITLLTITRERKIDTYERRCFGKTEGVTRKEKNEKVILIELQKQYNVQNMHTPHHLYLL